MKRSSGPSAIGVGSQRIGNESSGLTSHHLHWDNKGTVWVTRSADEEYAKTVLYQPSSSPLFESLVWGCIMKGSKGLGGTGIPWWARVVG